MHDHAVTAVVDGEAAAAVDAPRSLIWIIYLIFIIFVYTYFQYTNI